jgi:CarD family transcriptional regulator, regulator of rRNA transcription
VAISSGFLVHFPVPAGGICPPATRSHQAKRTKKGAGLYKVGDKVVYPHHGAGTVVKKEKREILGEKREYLTIKILHNDMTVNVPSENAEQVGLRKVIGEDMVKVVVKALTGGGTQMPKNWNRRFKHNRDKMKTGDILELAEVVRNLSLRDSEKGLSTGEKQMFVKAKKILASELMYAKDMDEEEAAEWLDGVLVGATQNGANGRKTAATKPAKVASKTTATKPVARKTAAKAKSAATTKPKTKARASSR